MESLLIGKIPVGCVSVRERSRERTSLLYAVLIKLQRPSQYRIEARHHCADTRRRSDQAQASCSSAAGSCCRTARAAACGGGPYPCTGSTGSPLNDASVYAAGGRARFRAPDIGIGNVQ